MIATATSLTLTYDTLHDDDRAFLGQLPSDERANVLVWFGVVNDILAADRPSLAIRECAVKMRGRPGFSDKSIERAYYRLRRGANWRDVLVNKNRVRVVRSKWVTPAVVDAWQEVMQRHQRKYRPAFRDVLRRYQAGEAFGGISWKTVWAEEHPHAPIPDRVPPHMPLPPGWSYDTFIRHKLRTVEAALVRQGTRAAQEFGYHVHTTRCGLAVGQGYYFDDMLHDFKLRFVGQQQAVRPWELGCADVFSGYKLEPGFRPERFTGDGTKERLRERDMRLYVAHLLINVGYHPDGCTLYAEHGTAAINDRVEQMLKAMTGGMIRVQRSGIEGAKQLAGLYSGKGAGNPRLKAAYESLHNLSHNELDALPMSTGMDRQRQPESLYGADAINTKLLIAAYALTPERAALLRFPAWEWNVGLEAVREAYYNLNRRIDHELEGWLESKLVKHQFRLSPALPWMDHCELDRLEPAQRAAVEALITREDFYQVVRQSPWDVWNAGQSALVKLPPYCMLQICGDDLCVTRKCPASEQIEFQDQDAAPGSMWFQTRYVEPSGVERRLQEGVEYRWLVNPFDTRQCFVATARGEYLGTVRRCEVPMRTDMDAIRREQGLAAKLELDAARDIMRRNRKLIEGRIEDAQHNTAVLRGDAVTDAERQREADIEGQAVTAGERAAANDFRNDEEPEPIFASEEITDLLKSE